MDCETDGEDESFVIHHTPDAAIDSSGASARFHSITGEWPMGMLAASLRFPALCVILGACGMVLPPGSRSAALPCAIDTSSMAATAWADDQTAAAGAMFIDTLDLQL